MPCPIAAAGGDGPHRHRVPHDRPPLELHQHQSPEASGGGVGFHVEHSMNARITTARFPARAGAEITSARASSASVDNVISPPAVTVEPAPVGPPPRPTIQGCAVGRLTIDTVNIVEFRASPSA